MWRREKYSKGREVGVRGEGSGGWGPPCPPPPPTNYHFMNKCTCFEKTKNALLKLIKMFKVEVQFFFFFILDQQLLINLFIYL